MRILLACPYAWDAPGGVQVHVGQLAGRLRELGHQVVVVAPAASTPSETYVRAAGRPVRVRFNESVAPISPSPRAYSVVRDTLRSFNPDVVHAHEPFVPGPSMFAAWSARAPVVATFHAYADRALILSAAGPLLHSVWRRLSVRIAVSEAAAAFVRKAIRGARLRIVPNGVDVRLFEGARPAELPAGRRILFVNRLDPRKGFRTMLDAFRRLASGRKDVRLVVAGDGPDRGALSDLPSAVRDRITMAGNVPHDDLPPYHAAAEVFCAPATGRESFGIVLVEAMAAGLPVVATDIPGYREVVRHDVEGILVPPRDPGAVAGGIERVLDDADLAKRLGEAGRQRARRYSWDTVGAEIEEIYRQAGKETRLGR